MDKKIIIDGSEKVRQGWRMFACDNEEEDCTHTWTSPSRDHSSLSSETCPQCGADAHPHGHSADANIPVNALGNLLSSPTYDIIKSTIEEPYPIVWAESDFGEETNCLAIETENSQGWGFERIGARLLEDRLDRFSTRAPLFKKGAVVYLFPSDIKNKE